jgi:SAM-dependent methyltransferase
MAFKHLGHAQVLRTSLKSVSNLVRSGLGTHGLAARLSAVEAKLDAALAPAPSAALTPNTPPVIAPTLFDTNVLLHQSRSAFLREMPEGAQRLLSVGCAGNWYFDWIDGTYGHVAEHLGIEFYALRPDNLPSNVTWIANTASNMSAVASASCDLVFSGQNLEHLWADEVAGFLIEAARVLKPGGILAVDSPNRDITRELNWSHPEHTVEFTVPEIHKLLELSGFDVTKSGGIWLNRDPRTGRLLPHDPNVSDTEWSAIERLIAARIHPEHSFIWWLEGRRSSRTPDSVAIDALLTRIYEVAWPERTRRLKLAPGLAVEPRPDGDWVVVPPGHAGIVFYGPYMPLRKGRHQATFEVQPDTNTSGTFAICDVAAGAEGRILTSREVSSGMRSITLNITAPELIFGGQFRCVSTGRGGFAVRRQVSLVESLD